MREILFRAKSVWGNWCEGYLVKMPTYFRMSTRDDLISFGVDAQTIGQYTGLTDKNGKKIFEGDIVRNGDYTMIVVWYDFHAAFMLAFRVDGDYFEAISNGHIYLEVIGNIHDNPELLWR